jgi:drug/metabolite transporter (DMT)-like permease
MVSKAAARLAAVGPVVPLVVLWYLSATVAVTSSRAVLQATGLPFCLSAAQFAISSLLSRWMLQYGLPWLTGGVYKPMLRDLSIDRPERKFVQSIALTYTLGFVFTNVSLALCNASFSETVKSAEPISSLALAAMTRGEDAVTPLEWLTTLPIVCGVALSSYGDASFHALGFLAAFASNFMFSMRGLNTKQLRCAFAIAF